MKASVVIPIQVSSDEFLIYLENLTYCLAAAALQTVACEIVLVDYNSNAKYVEQIKAMGKGCTYVRDDRADSIWSRGRSLNVGIRKAAGELVLFVDSDCVLPPDYVAQHIASIEEGSFTFSKFYNTTAEIVKSGNYQQLRKQEHIRPPLDDCCSHQGFLAKTLRKHGLFDEVYSGWGAEDNDLFLRMRRAGLVAVEVAARPIHLWHPTWKELMHRAGRGAEQNSTLQKNRERFFTYKKTGKK